MVDKKSTMPILNNVLIKSKGAETKSGATTISVSGTDLEIGLTADYEAQVEKRGAMTLGAKALFDIVRALPEDEVTKPSLS